MVSGMSDYDSRPSHSYSIITSPNLYSLTTDAHMCEQVS